MAVIEGGTFGGTCLNVGCIPTKMFVYAADGRRRAPVTRPRYGVDATAARRALGRRPRPGLRPHRPDRRGRRATTASTAPTRPRSSGTPASPVTAGSRSTSARRRERSLTADQVVIAAGAHPVVPDVVRDSGVPFHTSDTIMRIDELPEHARHHRRRLHRGRVGARLLRASACGSASSRVARCSCATWTTRSRSRFTALARDAVGRAHGHAVTRGRAATATACALDLEHDGHLGARRRPPARRHRPRAQHGRPGAGRRRRRAARRRPGRRRRRTAARRATACGRSATSARRTSSSTWPTPRPGSSPTTSRTLTTSGRSTTASCPPPSSAHRRSPRSA